MLSSSKPCLAERVTAFAIAFGFTFLNAHAQTDTNTPVRLPDVIVTGMQDAQRSYVLTNATTATKTDTPLIQIPQSIQVVPQTVLEEQQTRTLIEALQNVSGVSDAGSGIGFDRYTVRGFEANGLTYQDGLVLDRLFWVQPEMTAFERVEVLKGPASVLYGQIAPGGLVNLTSKRPLPEAHYDFDFTLGNYDFYEPRFDLGGPLNDGKSIAYRMNGVYRTRESFIDFVESERFFVAPALSWLVTPKTHLTFLTSFSYDDARLPQGLPAVGTVLPNVNGRIPLSRYVGEPFNRVELFQGQAGYLLEHQFSDQWKLGQTVRATFTDVDSFETFPGSLEADQRTLSRSVIETLAEYYTVELDTRLQGQFETGAAEHTVVGGLDVQIRDMEMDFQFGEIASLDVFSPVYGSQPTAFSPFQWLENDLAIGGYLQDQVRIWDQLTLLGGVRFDHSETEMQFPPGDSTTQDDFAVSPRAGILYQITPQIAPYFSYARSFLPITFGTTADGSFLDPEEGEQFELGIKADALDGKLTTTVAFYHLIRENVSVSDPNNPAFSIQTGEQRSRGIELDLAYNILPGWNAIGVYAYNDAEITEETDATLRGNRPNNVPEHSGSIWTTYALQTGPLKGLGVGVGGRFVGERTGDLQNTFDLPGYGVLDASLFYRWRQFRAQVNVKNALDKEIFASAFDRNRVILGEPLTVRGSVGWSF